MPRDANGNMTLVPGNPVITGTAISSTVHNATVADLAAEIQDSLSRSGKGGMTAPFINSDGSVGAPGISFASETNTGFWWAASAIRASVLGILRLTIDALGIRLADAATVSFLGSGNVDANGAGKTLALKTNSISRLSITDTDVTISTTPVAGSTSVATTAYVDATILQATVTPAGTSNWSTSGCYIHKAGKLVTGYFEAIHGAAGTFTDIATMPAGARPQSTVTVLGSLFDQSTSKTYLARFSIATTGTVSCTTFLNTDGLEVTFQAISGWSGDPPAIFDTVTFMFSYVVA